MKATAKQADCSEKRLSSLPMELMVASKIRLRYLEYKGQLVSAEGKKLSQAIWSVKELLWVRTGQSSTRVL